MKLPNGMRANVDCGLARCPRCERECPCVCHDEVDIGVGIQTGNHEYFCAECGGWAYLGNGEFAFRDLEETVVDEKLRDMVSKAEKGSAF